MIRKSIWIAGFILAFVVPTLAQQEHTLKVNNDEINLIGKALGKMPFDEVAALIQKLRTQLIDQQPKPASGDAKPYVPQVPKE